MIENLSSEDGPSPVARQLAEEIRQRRKRAGLSQPQLAALIGYTRQYVSLAERPKRGLPSAELAKAIDNALDAGGVLVTLRQHAHAERKAGRPGASPNESSGTSSSKSSGASSGKTTAVGRTGPEPRQSPDPAEVTNTNRSELVALAAAITFGARLDEPVERILTATDEQHIPTRVRAGDVRHLREAVEKLAAWDHQAGGGAVRRYAQTALRWAAGMLAASCTPSVRLELAATTAHLADLAGWATFDAGHQVPARRLFLFGLHAAHESGDLGVRAHVASGLARQEIHVGNWADGVELTQLGFTAANALTPNAIAMLHTVKALAYACKLDVAECHLSIGDAIDTYQPDSISDDPAWIRYFTPAKLDGDIANAMYDLSLGGADVGDRTAHRLALLERMSIAFRQYPPERARSKAITATRLATLLCLEGEPSSAHQIATEAISLARQVRSARLADDLRLLMRTWPPADTDQTRDLRHRISTLLTDMT